MERTVIERIAIALERQADQYDASVKRNDAAREANLARHHAERGADIERYNAQHDESMREMSQLRAQLDAALLTMDRWRGLVNDMERRVRALEVGRLTDAVDPHATK